MQLDDILKEELDQLLLEQGKIRRGWNFLKRLFSPKPPSKLPSLPRKPLRLPPPRKPAGLLTGPEGWQKMEQELRPALVALRNAEITVQGRVPTSHAPVGTVGEIKPSISTPDAPIHRQWRRSQLGPDESYASRYHNATPYKNAEPDPTFWGDGTERSLKELLNIANGAGGREFDPLVHLAVNNIIRNRINNFQSTLHDARRIWQDQPFPWQLKSEDVLGQSTGVGGRTRGAIGRIWNETALVPIRKDLKDLAEYLGFFDPRRGMPVRNFDDTERFRVWGENSQDILKNVEDSWKTTWEIRPEPGFESLTFDELRKASQYLEPPKYPFDIDPINPPVKKPDPVDPIDDPDPVIPLREEQLFKLLQKELLEILKNGVII